MAIIVWLFAPTQAAAEARAVLALYDSAYQRTPSETAVHRFAELPLNHLGYRLAYHDLRKGFPRTAPADGLAGVLVWLQAGSKPPPGTHAWLLELSRSGVRIVLFANTASLPEAAPHLVTERAAFMPGYAYRGIFVEVTHDARIASQNRRLFDIEGAIGLPLPPFPSIEAISPPDGHPNHAIHLSISHKAGRLQRTSIAAATGPFGGFIAEDFAIADGGEGRSSRWLVDPFRFFSLALARPPHSPVPDVTTASGRRIFFSHVDGDGWNNPSLIENYRDRSATAAEVLLREIVEKFRDLPVTIAPVAGDVDTGPHATAQARKVAREMLAMPHVEIGSHTYTHPYDWKFLQNYDRARELDLRRAILKQQKSAYGTDHQAAAARTIRPARLYDDTPYDRVKEVQGAIAVIQSLAPAGKTVKLYQWSGSTSPDEATIRLVRQAGIANINGGDPRLDLAHPSLTYLSALSKAVGGERQVYAPASNEFIYWDGRNAFAAYALHQQMLDRTESPRRLKPANLYYHVYSAENDATLGPVRTFLERAQNGRVTPIPASDYVAMVEGFYSTRIVSAGDGAWRVMSRGGLETLRVDDAAQLMLDRTRSNGVIGTQRHGDAMYIALDQAVAEPLIALKRATGAAVGWSPLLVESRWRVRSLRTSPCRLDFVATGFGTGDMVWDGLHQGRYSIDVRGNRDQEHWHTDTQVTGDRQLRVDITLTAIEPVQVSIACLQPN